MVERPIKKSERQSPANAESDSQNSEFEPRGSSRREGRDNRVKDKAGKGKRKFEDKAPPVNPALARGPKPTKFQPKPEPEPEPEAETPMEVSAETETPVVADTEAVAEPTPAE